MEMKMGIVLTIFFQLMAIAVFGQDQVVYDYADLNYTTVSAEYLEEDQLLKETDKKSSWQQSLRGSSWYYFEFGQDILIDKIELVFSDNTCLTNCRIEYQFITNDTVIEATVNQLASTYKLGITTTDLIIHRKEVYPQGPKRLVDIAILSETKPLASQRLLSKKALTRRERVDIQYRIEGLTAYDIRQRKKVWQARRRFYRRHVKKRLADYEREEFESEIFFYEDEEDFCYEVESYVHVDHFSNRTIATLFDDCHCDVREIFFERRMSPTKKMTNRDFYFLDHKISYDSDTAEQVLVNYLEGGDAWAGHAIPHICLMNSRQHIPIIKSLTNGKNTFTRFCAIEGLLYFGEDESALKAGIEFCEEEIHDIKTLGRSNSSYYPTKTLIVLHQAYPEVILPLLLELYESYRSLYPPEMKIGESWIYLDPKTDLKIIRVIESFQGADEKILRYIESYINDHPKASSYREIEKFKRYIDKKEAYEEDQERLNRQLLSN
ncbi:MAG: hypothetical protein AAGI23_17060 [Bacteroidota bacterium]